MPRLKEDELLRLACLYAERDQEEFVRAHSHMPNDPAAKRSYSFLRQLRAYRLKRWGRTLLESKCDAAEEIQVGKIAERLKKEIDE